MLSLGFLLLPCGLECVLRQRAMVTIVTLFVFFLTGIMVLCCLFPNVWKSLFRVCCPLFFLFVFLNFYLFIYLFMAVLGLRFCERAFSSCGKWGPLFIAVHGPLIIAASLVAEHRLQTRRVSNCGSRANCCSAAGGIFPDQGSNPCPLHWQADSQPLRHQGSPVVHFSSGLW